MGSFSTSASSTSRTNKTHHSTSPDGTTRGSPLAQNNTPENLADEFCSTPAPTGLSSSSSGFLSSRRTLPAVRGRPDNRIASCMGASLPGPKHLQGSRILCENSIMPGRPNRTGLWGARPHLIIPIRAPDLAGVMSLSRIHTPHSEHPEPKSTPFGAR